MSLPTQPLEVKDFSGGITDNWLQGDPRRYQYADNYWITNDHKLQVRDPLRPIDLVNYILPTGQQRVSSMFTMINETILLAQSGRKIFTIDPTSNTWLSISGPSGNEPLQGGDINCQTTLAEFQRQGYLTTDGTSSENGTLPSKIYRNSSNAWIAKTAGLPRAYVANPWTNSTLLQTAIANANALRASMLSHMLDAQFATYAAFAAAYPSQGVFPNNPAFLFNNGFLHFIQDRYSLSYLTPITFVPFNTSSGTGDPYIPNPLPTPAPVATDLPSLLVLVQALVNAMTWHHKDSLYAAVNTPADTVNTTSPTAVNTAGQHINVPISHMNIKGGDTAVLLGLSFTVYRGPSVAPTVSGTSIPDLRTACTVLDDMYQKWYWHQSAVNTHSYYNDPTVFNRYLITNPKIGTVNWTQNPDLSYTLATNLAPTISGDFGDLYNFANNCKYIYNLHVNDLSNLFGAHAQADTAYYYPGNQITLPDCTSLDSAYLLTFWLRALYYQHQSDANATVAFSGSNNVFTAIKYSTTAGSATLSSITDLSGNALTIPVNSWMTCLGSTNAVLNPLTNSSVVAGGKGGARTARITASASGTATMDRQAAQTQSGLLGQISASKYHISQTVTYTNSTGTGQIASIAFNTGGTSSTSAELLGAGPGAVPSSQLSCIQLLQEFISSFGSHMQNYASHNTQDFMSTVTSQTATPFFVPAVAQKSYAFYFGDDYVVEPNGIEYLVQGNPVVSASQTVAAPQPSTYVYTSVIPTYYGSVQNPLTRTNTITNLPVLTNTARTNYDTNNVKLWIFATTDGGTTYYLLDKVANGTTSYTDANSDTLASNNQNALNTRQTLYTSGGVVGFDQPPQCKFIHNLNGTTYYGGITDTGQFFPNRIRQSVQFAPDAAPATFYDDLDDEITGLSSTRSDLIAFCRNTIYRMQGGFTSTGQGALLHTRISDTLGCDNAKSIVRTEIGVFFAGFDGFYYTDGYQIIKISLELDKTYASLTASANQKRSIYGCYDKVNRRVYWAMKRNATDAENNVAYIFYLNYGVKPSGTFTRMLSGLNFQPSSMAFQNGTLYVGDGRGYVLFLDAYNKGDSLIDVTQPASNWQTTYIPYYYASTAVDAGSTFKRKWMTKAHIVGRNVGNASLTPFVIRDANADEKGVKALAPINYIDNDVWGDPTKIWETLTDVWGNSGKFDVMRRFPASTLRSDFIQFVLQPEKVAVYSSSVHFPAFCNAVVDSVGKTATIQTPSGYTSIVWPLDVVGYVIAFQTDGYISEFPITALDTTHTIITFSDPTNLTLSLTVPWVIRGIKKNQKMELTSYVLHYALLGDKVQKYPGAASNSGPGNGGENPS